MFLLEIILSQKDYSRIPLSASIVPATAFKNVIAEQGKSADPPPKSPAPHTKPSEPLKAPKIVPEAHLKDPFMHIEDIFDAGEDSNKDELIAATLKSAPKQDVQVPAQAVVESNLVPPVPTFKSRNPLRQNNRQYRTQTPLSPEEKEVADCAFRSVIEGTTTISNHDLLVIAHDLSRRVKTVMSAKRIPKLGVANTAEVHFTEMVQRDASGRLKEEQIEAFYISLSDTGVVVGAQMQALKAITLTINP
ncbi:hypothetical protein BDZ89DRAFT_1050172 [Hymenopellis radicata]|nr:hypothetical protein BDZ89DRAFT_1050172 [Hymenopellis radicata]